MQKRTRDSLIDAVSEEGTNPNSENSEPTQITEVAPASVCTQTARISLDSSASTLDDQSDTEINVAVDLTNKRGEKMSKCGKSPERMSHSSGYKAPPGGHYRTRPRAIIDPNKPRINDYEVSRTLGTGSYGRVLLVQERASGTYYALKRLKKADIVRLKQVEHTNNECRLLALVPDSPFVVKLAKSFQDARYLYLLMEYVAGGELFGLLRRVRTLPSFVAQFYAAEIVLGLEDLHARDIIYRDLKPENVLLAEDGHLRLADFGFAKVVPDITWTFCGTPEYLAPELVSASGSGYGRAVDWYSLGVLIYEMLFGRPPFYNENHLKLYDQIANQQAKFPDNADPLAVDLMTRLLEKDPTRRLGFMKEGSADIRAHKWFRAINWDQLKAKLVKPPYKPKVGGPGDALNFDKYPEDTDPPVDDDELDEYGRLFYEFQ